MQPGNLPATRQTFRKVERLVSRRLFEQLLKNGRNIREGEFRLVWQIAPLAAAVPAQAAFSVPKRIFKKAVDRNHVKRLMREVYRKNKADIYPLLEQSHRQCSLLWVYNGKTVPTYSETEKKITLILGRFVEEFQKVAG